MKEINKEVREVWKENAEIKNIIKNVIILEGKFEETEQAWQEEKLKIETRKENMISKDNGQDQKQEGEKKTA